MSAGAAAIRPHRNSFPVDHARSQVARRFGNGSFREKQIAARCIVEAAEEWAESVRQSAKPKEGCADCAKRKDRQPCRQCHGVSLTDNHIKTLRRVLRHCVDVTTGKIEVTIERITRAAGWKSRITTIRHLKALRAAGWIDWVRRIHRKEDAGPWVPTANAYFFEISRIPKKARKLLHEKLQRAGVRLTSDPTRQGSGPVPSFRERMIAKLGRGAKRVSAALDRKRHKERVAEADWQLAEWQYFGDIPAERWAELRHPGDSEAQQAYNARLGLHPSQ